MEAVCVGKADEAVSFFRESKLFGDARPVVDVPYGRFEGLEGIRAFAEGFVSRFGADFAFLTPVVQTVANGRVASELVVNFVVDGEIEEVPMFVIADLRTPGLLDEVRMYCHFSFVPNLQAYRKPIFPVAHREMGDPGLLTGAVREYYEALHHAPAVDVDRICKVFGPDASSAATSRGTMPAAPTTATRLCCARATNAWQPISLAVSPCAMRRSSTTVAPASSNGSISFPAQAGRAWPNRDVRHRGV